MTPDLMNAVFELFGALIILLNIFKVLEDRLVRGVHWMVVGFFSLWGIWNLFYYPLLGQWMSFSAGVLMVCMNLLYTGLLIYYTWKEQQYIKIPEKYLLPVYPNESSVLIHECDIIPFKEDNDVGC